MATSPVNYGANAPAATGSTSGAGSPTDPSNDPQATKEEFISLLVAQLQNQDPLDPTDGTQFLSQLTEINSLEQLLEIRTDLDQLAGAPAGGSDGGSTGSGTSASQAASGGNDRGGGVSGS